MERLHQSPAWMALEKHQAALAQVHLRGLFRADPQRFQAHSHDLGPVWVDFSKNLITEETWTLLEGLAAEAGLFARRDAMFAGEPINATERRAVLHTALRSPSGRPVILEGRDVSVDVHGVLQQMFALVDTFHRDALFGATGAPLRAVVHLGIGGSDLGPAMVCDALRAHARPGVEVRFASNVDGADLDLALRGLDPRETLIVVASKTFTTVETFTNARAAVEWLAAAVGREGVGAHLAAITASPAAAHGFGVSADRTFPIWDWVGGRYSLWSAIGLPIALLVGSEGFRSLLDGANAVDEEFRAAPFARNTAAKMGMLSIWYRNFWKFPSKAVLPYAQNLRRLPAYLQQADMESNGKSTTLDGAPVAWSTGPVLFGEPGTNAQHSFFQLLHQGTDVIPADFIAVARTPYPTPRHHAVLLANCLAQTEALLWGRTRDEAMAELTAQGVDALEAARLAPHKVFPGNRPTTTIVLDELRPHTLGMLLALYEHSIFVQGAVWGINSFDQWGVELGKAMATRLLPAMEGAAPGPHHDASTLGLVSVLERFRKSEKG
jgi:glucose-6-phosphate isomerase